MSESILFACTANICRSSLMHYTFLNEVDPSRPLKIRSAGTSAQLSSTICPQALSLVPSRNRDVAAAHIPSAIADLPLAASLIITASRIERAAIARAFPEVRPRLFTLSEAVLLGRLALSSPKLQFTADGSVIPVAQRIDSQRGMVTIPRRKKRSKMSLSTRPRHPFDIPDAHHSTRFAHKNTLKRVQAEAVELAAIVTKLQNTV